MAEILEVKSNTVKVGDDSGKIVEFPLASLHFSNPKVGDQVRVYKDENKGAVIVNRVESRDTADSGDRRRVNKVAYILVTFFFGFFGVHRFIRGQVGLGLLMLFFGWLTLGIWWLVDFIIGLTKLSMYEGDDFVFTPGGRFAK